MSSLLYKKIDGFDVRAWLDDINIPYRTEGRNIGQGWLGLQCPFCDDHSNHFGIAYTTTKHYNCWICGEKGSVIKLIMALEKCTYTAAMKIIDEYQDYQTTQLRQDIQIRYKESIVPKSISNVWPNKYLDYLRNRRYDPDVLIPKYGLQAFPYFGLNAWRIYIPCSYQKHVVNYTSIDITGTKKKQKYKHCPNDKAIIPMKNLLYNMDNITGRRVIIVEGVTDVWRLGDGAIATMGIEFTRNQMVLLKKLSPQKIHIIFDAEPLAQKKAIQLSDYLIFYGGLDSEVLTLPSGDPDDLSDEQAQYIKKQLL
uniref:Putative primase n=1 Tax=viral metagenome TaxID=1070528 RepID=A0A6M3LDR2_9ZZZZ